jgi:predicted GNAT superfamily acetyltransferase
MKEVDVRIRRAAGLDDYLAAVELQRKVWSDDAHVATLPMLLLANKFGGSVIVAEKASGEFIGFSFALLSREQGEQESLFWWSHMTAVTESYRNKGVGLRLKMKQREEALASGIDQIRWTFDPLQAVNAHFNINKLGVIVRKYEENLYGLSGSPLHQGLPTDRFVAEWRLNSERVQERIGAEQPSLILRDIDRIPRINPADSKPSLHMQETLLMLEIPTDLAALKRADLARAGDWQKIIREACLHYFPVGYAVTDFILLNQPRPQALYVLERVVR